MTSRTDVAQTALAIAARTSEAEFHCARHLVHVAGAIALRANCGRAAHGPTAIAGLTSFLPRYVETHLRATDRLPKVDVETVFKIRSLFRTAARSLATPAAEELAEDVAEGSGAARTGFAAMIIIDVIGKIEATETHPRVITRARARSSARATRRNVVGIKAVLIVDLPLLGIAQNVVGFLDFLEALLGGFIAGVQVGMILARKLAVRFADLVFFGCEIGRAHV